MPGELLQVKSGRDKGALRHKKGRGEKIPKGKKTKERGGSTQEGDVGGVYSRKNKEKGPLFKKGAGKISRQARKGGHLAKRLSIGGSGFTIRWLLGRNLL